MDLVGATFSRFVSNQVCSVFKLRCSCAVAVGMSLCVDVIVKSSAYDIMLCWKVCGSVVHVDVKECGGQNRALGDSVGEISFVR